MRGDGWRKSDGKGEEDQHFTDEWLTRNDSDELKIREWLEWSHSALQPRVSRIGERHGKALP